MKYSFPGRSRAALAILVAIVAAWSLSACASSNPGPTGPAETTPITLPDLADDREPTSIADDAARLESAFATTPVAPAEDFTYELDGEEVTITGYTGDELVLVIPDTIEGKPVTVIAEDALAGRTGLRALSIPSSVRTIGIGALEGCKSLSTLRTPVYTCNTAPYFGALFGASSYEINASHIPAGLTTLILTGGEHIPDYGFYDCPFEIVSVPATMKTVGSFAFWGCEGLRYIPLGDTALTSIGERAFTNCRDLFSLDIPESVQSLGFAMLEGCGKLETLTLPFVGEARRAAVAASSAEGKLDIFDSVETASPDERDELLEDYYAKGTLGYLFGAASYTFTAGYIPASLIRVTLLEGCGDIPDNAFFECASIREIILPEGVTSIGRRAFYGCERLAAMTLPDGVMVIGESAFFGCIRLVNLEVGAGLTTLGVQAFMNCLSLRSVTLPGTVTHLPNATFAGCLSLESLSAPGVTVLGEQVFRHCDKLIGWN